MKSIRSRDSKVSRGFTLIELLVVIAIIGLLASIILASLNSARSKGADATITSDLEGARSQAEIDYDSANNYSGVCADGTVTKQLQGAASADSLTWSTITLANGASASNIACHDSADSYVIEAPMKTSGYWCVDSTGISAATTTAVGSTATACGVTS